MLWGPAVVWKLLSNSSCTGGQREPGHAIVKAVSRRGKGSAKSAHQHTWKERCDLQVLNVHCLLQYWGSETPKYQQGRWASFSDLGCGASALVASSAIFFAIASAKTFVMIMCTCMHATARDESSNSAFVLFLPSLQATKPAVRIFRKGLTVTRLVVKQLVMAPQVPVRSLGRQGLKASAQGLGIITADCKCSPFVATNSLLVVCCKAAWGCRQLTKTQRLPSPTRKASL